MGVRSISTSRAQEFCLMKERCISMAHFPISLSPCLSFPVHCGVDYGRRLNSPPLSTTTTTTPATTLMDLKEGTGTGNSSSEDGDCAKSRCRNHNPDNGDNLEELPEYSECGGGGGASNRRRHPQYFRPRNRAADDSWTTAAAVQHSSWSTHGQGTYMIEGLHVKGKSG